MTMMEKTFAAKNKLGVGNFQAHLTHLCTFSKLNMHRSSYPSQKKKKKKPPRNSTEEFGDDRQDASY
jgi:hypothetical protein